MKKRIFITGGTGFIGVNLIHKLATSGFETASYDALLNFAENNAYYKRCLSLRKKHYAKPSTSYKGDIRDPGRLSRAIKDFKPHVIVHLAGLPMARVSKQYEDQIIPINLTGTLNVLRAFEESKAEKIIYTSSSMAYGHFKQTPQTENFILDPINLYGACKAAGEYFVKLSQKNWVIVRPTSVYGFTDCANRVSQILIDAAAHKKSAWVIKGETLDFSYVEDVVGGFIRTIVSRKANRQTFNISAGVARGTDEFAEIVKKFFPGFEYEVRSPIKEQVFRGPQDIQRAQTLLNFKPLHTLESGVKKTLQLMEEYNFYNLAHER